MNSTDPPTPELTWGVNIMPDLPVAQVAELATLAEGLGFDRCWLYDEGLATRELYVALTAIVLATNRIEVGPGITNPYTRHPSVAAAAVASLHELSGGRAFLGLGVGGSLTLDPIGVARYRPAATLRDTVRACWALFSGRPVEYDGEQISLRQAQLAYGDPSIPIWVAGRGPRILATGAELADGVSLDHIHRDFLGEQVQLIRHNAANAGNNVQIAYSASIVTSEADLERVRQHMTYRLVDSPPEVKAAIGLTGADSDAIRAAMADGLDVAGRLVGDGWILPFVVHGTPAQCAARINELATEHGFCEFTVPVPDPHVAEETISQAAEVARLAAELHGPVV